nr:MAG TPA: Restriction endonuclease [Caudoviricetes sp.]
MSVLLFFAAVFCFAVVAIILLIKFLEWFIEFIWYFVILPFTWMIAGKVRIPEPIMEEVEVTPAKSFENMTGLEFEHVSAQWLVRQGYHSVAVTQASNDFGADITALDENDMVWVFQCKLYSSKLDNTAIQEVVASKAHYDADCAGVITNSTFTKAAEQLAAENHVKLISLMSWEI